MIRFRCTGCGRLLGVAERKIGQRVTCPACKDKVAVPAHSQDDPQLAPASNFSRSAPPRRPVEEEEILDDLPVIEEEAVDELEIIEKVEKPRRRKPKSRREREADDKIIAEYYGRENSHHVPSLLLLCIPAPLVLFIVVGSFLLNPMSGMASLFWGAGWIWFNLIVAEEGVGKVLCVNFVPFYALIFAVQNIDRAWLPWILIAFGGISSSATSAWAKKNNPNRRMQGPSAPLVRTWVCRFPDAHLPLGTFLR